MKNFINLISGKKAMYVMLVLAGIAAVLEIITAIRLGTRIAFGPMGVVFASMALWADALDKKVIKAKEAKNS